MYKVTYTCKSLNGGPDEYEEEEFAQNKDAEARCQHLSKFRNIEDLEKSWGEGYYKRY